MLEKIILIVALFSVTLLIATYLTLAERKVAAWLQDRIGPDRAGPWGLLQPLADAGKMFFKEDFIPTNADKWLFIIGIVSIGVYGIMIGGWASNNKFSLFGAIRASSQMISYELAMGISIITIVMMSGSLNLRDIVEDQHGFNWYAWKQPLCFVVFFVCAMAECNRAPFDLPECESELIGGYHTEYGSMKLGFFLFAEYINMFISCAVISAVFFGGYNFPGMDYFSGNTLAILGTLVFFGKTFLFIFVFMWIRWTLPRFRYDQLMHLGWKKLIPIALINMLVTGIIIAAVSGWFNGEKPKTDEPMKVKTEQPDKRLSMNANTH